MNDPVIEKICKKTLATLQSITADNGYNYTLNARRRRRWEEAPKHLNTILRQLPPLEVQGDVTGKKSWRQQFMIDVFVAQADTPENKDVSPDEIHNRIGADIEKALMADRQVNIDGTQYAIDTTIDGWDEFGTLQGDYVGREYLFTVAYRCRETDPYEVG